MKNILFALLLMFVEDVCFADDFKDLAASVYCPSCQGQALDESNSETAMVLKNQIREMLSQGKSPEVIRQHLVEVYGERILLMPGLQPHTYLLWFAPLLAFGVFMIILFSRMRFFQPRNSVKS
jgi:cytochrome c-type biogenesis protein CcmH